ncbi:MAG: hypothetical protein H8E44_19875 [Planctomycetes bacterium]|nr:hypothetical protein [Planctomycetota bacterium]MBL7037830.1 hypothetical protein [Pirellulaceae bacterium]
MAIANSPPSKSSWRFLVIGLMLIPSFSTALAAEEESRNGEGEVHVFDKDVFEDWGHWEEKAVETPYYPEGDVFAYHAYLTDVKRVVGTKAQEDCLPLPDSLIISPGEYQFRDQAFALQEEGLYRFIEVGEEQQQRIVYQADLHALLSGIAWIVSHGNSDHGKSHEVLAEEAKTRKIFITCGPVSGWASRILGDHGIRARSATSLTLGHWNTYDNGHAMIEVYRKDLRKWVLYDVDGNCFFTWRETPLSLVEFAYAVMSDKPYEINKLANDTRLDVSNFKGNDGKADYAFFCERMNAAVRQWYRRIVQVPMLHDAKLGRCFFDAANRQRIESYNKSFKYLEKGEFRRTFYGEVPDGE